MYCKSIDDYLINIRAGRSIIPYMMKEFDKRGIDTTDIKAMTDYLKSDEDYNDGEARLFNDAWDAQMNDDIDAGKWDKKYKEREQELKDNPDSFITMEKFLDEMAADKKARENTEKQIKESRQKRLERRW